MRIPYCGIHFCWGVVNNVYVRPAGDDATRRQDTNQRSLCNTDHEILRDLRQEAEYLFAVASATCGVHTELHEPFDA